MIKDLFSKTSSTKKTKGASEFFLLGNKISPNWLKQPLPKTTLGTMGKFLNVFIYCLPYGLFYCVLTCTKGTFLVPVYVLRLNNYWFALPVLPLHEPMWYEKARVPLVLLCLL